MVFVERLNLLMFSQECFCAKKRIIPDIEFIILLQVLNTVDGGIDYGCEIFQYGLFKSLFDKFWI